MSVNLSMYLCSLCLSVHPSMWVSVSVLWGAGVNLRSHHQVMDPSGGRVPRHCCKQQVDVSKHCENCDGHTPSLPPISYLCFSPSSPFLLPPSSPSRPSLLLHFHFPLSPFPPPSSSIILFLHLLFLSPSPSSLPFVFLHFLPRYLFLFLLYLVLGEKESHGLVFGLPLKGSVATIRVASSPNLKQLQVL